MADPHAPSPDVSDDADESSGQAVTLLSAQLDQMSKVEKTKVESQGFFWVSGKGERHSFAAELDGLSRGDTETLSGGAADLSKHFGIYKQQERIEGRKNGPYIFMVRLKCPAGGEVSPEQWQALDAAADRFADGTLRLTTRQGVQFHHVIGKNLGPLVRYLNGEYRDRGYTMSTLGACGDVNRNTMCGPLDDLDAELPLRSAELAHEIASELAPRAGAESYRQIFLVDEENERLVPLDQEEPLYGRHYLPRKFKVGIAHPRDGSVDLLTQDVGLLAVVDGKSAGESYDLYAGGGLGVTHNKPSTQQLLALYLGRIPRAQCVAAVRAIVIIQKENGERADRKQARFKYTIRRIGVDEVRRQLRERFEIALEDAEPQPLPDNRFFHGWTRQAGSEERWVLGIPVESGRLRDANGVRQRSAVRALVSELQLGVRITANQDLLLCHIPGAKRARVEEILREHGLGAEPRLGLARLQALACPAKPTCGLAMTEAEGILPTLMSDLEAAGLGDTDVVVRISGCPNSCSRPPTAEIGIIGYGKNHHIIQVGGLRNGGRIGHVLYERVPATELSQVVIAIARAIRDHAGGTPAGEFLARTPPEQLRAWVGHSE